MRRIPLAAVVALALALLGCASIDGHIDSTMTRADGFAVLSAGALSSALAGEMARRGYRMVDRSVLAAALDEVALGQTGLTRDQAVRLGNIATFRYILTAQTTYFQTRPGIPANATVQVIEAESGAIAGSLSWSNGGGEDPDSGKGIGMWINVFARKDVSSAAAQIAEKLDALVRGRLAGAN